MEVADGAGDDAMVATAILLFGPGGMELPGGYDTNEMSRCVRRVDSRNSRVNKGVRSWLVVVLAYLSAQDRVRSLGIV